MTNAIIPDKIIFPNINKFFNDISFIFYISLLRNSETLEKTRETEKKATDFSPLLWYNEDKPHTRQFDFSILFLPSFSTNILL